MRLTRREFLTTQAAAAGALALAPGITLGAVPEDLVRKAIPASGEMITTVGIGTNRYGVTAEVDKAPLRETLKEFVRLGGQVIDTAPSYGRGVSESVIGELTAELGIRDQLFFATKVDGRVEGPRQTATSLEKLKTDHAELIQVHNLRALDTLLPVLQGAKDEGLIRYVGVTTSRHEQFEDLENVLRSQPLDFVQLNFSLDDRLAAERLLPLAQDRGVAVLVNLPFGRGRLFEKTAEQALPDWAAEFDCQSWGQFFLKYLIGHPAVTCVIPGTRKVKHVQDNLAAARGRLPDEALRRRQQTFIDGL
ncbi:MAG: aldo/keto reductase [Pseudomonadota bacterium]